MVRLFIGLGAISGLLSVIFGAFGAHALKARLGADMLGVFETGVRYQMYHALALVLIGLAASARADGLLHAAGWAMVGGTIVFSGSLYLLVLTDTRWLGAITPFGGLAFIAGWALFAVAALRM